MEGYHNSGPLRSAKVKLGDGLKRNNWNFVKDIGETTILGLQSWQQVWFDHELTVLCIRHS